MRSALPVSKELQMELRVAEVDEMPWVNERYKEIRFLASEAGRDIVLIAEVDGERAGIGRVVPLSSADAEMGGIYVFEQYRRCGIARKIVEGLLEQAADFTTIYCLAFDELQEFYSSFGFSAVGTEDQVPEELLKRLRWCNNIYSKRHGTLFRLRQK